MLTRIQVDALTTALRARLNPNERQGWCERFALAQCKPATRSSLERKGYLESYLNPTSDKIAWRLTPEGIETAGAILRK